MRTAIVGGGAAGFFLAVNLKEMMPEMEVTILERSQRVLAKVEVSGGGRCNCTNSFAGISDLKHVYPRGFRLMKRLMNVFSHRDAYEWFEHHGVSLVTQADECVFPVSQDAHTIVNCLTGEAGRLGVKVVTGHKVTSLDELDGYDFVAVTTGGSPRDEGLKWLADKGIETVSPVPSLFTFSIDDQQLHDLMGTVAETATAYLPGTGFRATGPLLITHWGMSGPAILKLSSYAARHLYDHAYRVPLAVNWVSKGDTEILQELHTIMASYPQKKMVGIRPFGLSTRLWSYLATKAVGKRAEGAWQTLNKKEVNRLMTILGNDAYQVAGRAAFKDEFVTCGGVALPAVSANTLESKAVPRLFFAGEVLDIDGITGGFNFQAAWTTAFTVARAISLSCNAGEKAK